MTHHESDEQIFCVTYRAGQIVVKASLIARREGMVARYGIMLEQEDECGVCDLGTELPFAKQLFFDVVSGGVTACTLADIVQDRSGTLF